MASGGVSEVVVVGCGHIGLPLAVALANRGVRVLGYDIDAAKVEALGEGRTPMVEEGLDAALDEALQRGAIRFAAELAPSEWRRAYILAVPTPAEPGRFDDGPLKTAMAAVEAAAIGGDWVVVRSTVPIGTTRALAGAHPRLPFAACPDRSLSGRALADQFDLPHIVGGVTDQAAHDAADLLALLGRVVRVRDADTAEAVKLFANTHRDLMFAEANQFALICEATGLDFAEIAAAGADGYPRFSLARPGPVGGPCLSKDVHVLAASPDLAGADLRLLLQARQTNSVTTAFLARRVHADVTAEGGPVAILGLAFKGRPPVADRRGAFAGELADGLRVLWPEVEVRLWDPGDGPLGPVLDDAKVVVLANDHPDVAAVAWRLPGGTVLYDMSGLDVRPDGLTVRALGRNP